MHARSLMSMFVCCWCVFLTDVCEQRTLPLSKWITLERAAVFSEAAISQTASQPARLTDCLSVCLGGDSGGGCRGELKVMCCLKLRSDDRRHSKKMRLLSKRKNNHCLYSGAFLSV